MKLKKQISRALIIAVAAFVILLIPVSLLAQSGWYKLTIPTSSDLHAVCFKDANSGCVIGDNAIFKTIDGGLSWTQVQNFPFGEFDDFTFESLCYTNASTGWIAGDLYVNPPGQHHKVILKTTDAGNSWRYSYNALSESGLMSVCYKNPYVGFSVGGEVILRSGDLGVTWERCLYNSSENDDFTFTSVCFINSMTGYVAGKVYSDPPGILSQVVFKTVNAGTNWTEILRSPGTGLNSINFCSSNSGWVVGAGIIRSTTNGGITWILNATFGGLNSIYYLENVYFPDPLNGWVSGGLTNTITNEYLNLILKTSDGGQTWTQQTFSTGKSSDYKLNSVYFINSLTGWAVGDGGVIMKTTDGGTTYVEPNNESVPESYALYQNYPNPFNPETKIKFEIPSSEVGESPGRWWMRNADGVGLVTLKVFDVTGREVVTLVNEKLQPGFYEVTFDGSNLPSGVYFCQLKAGSFKDTKKLVLQK